MPPISEFYVGAAALGASGDVYLGVNLEFPGAAIGQTVTPWQLGFDALLSSRPAACQVHGEQCLVTIAAQQKESHLERLAVSAAPCGHCRQFMNETHRGGDISIAYDDVRLPLRELLPHSFGPADLGNNTPLLKHEPRTVVPGPSDADASLLEEACTAAAHSYSPYTGSPSGVVVRLGSGETFTGFYMENCAFNPSMPPLQAALIRMVGQGRGSEFAQVAEVVLVEDPKASIQQEGGTRVLLEATANQATLKVVHATFNE